MHSEDYHIFHFTSFIWICIFEQQSQFHFSNLCQEIWGKFSFGTVALNSNTRRADVPFSCFSNLHEINMRERERGREREREGQRQLNHCFQIAKFDLLPLPFLSLSLSLSPVANTDSKCFLMSKVLSEESKSNHTFLNAIKFLIHKSVCWLFEPYDKFGELYKYMITSKFVIIMCLGWVKTCRYGVR